MSAKSHERARFLLDQAMVEGISPDEQRWVDSHIEGCVECSRYAESSRRAIRALDSFAFELDPAAAFRMQTAIGGHARRLASIESSRRDSLAGILAVIVLTATGSIAMWQPAAWLAAQLNVPAPAWQIGFAVFWFLPSVLPGLLLFFRRRLIGIRSGGEGQAA